MAVLKVLTTKNHLADILSRWRELYKNEIEACEGTGYERYLHLLALPDAASIETIDEIIGNPTWTTRQCANCGSTMHEWLEIETFIGGWAGYAKPFSMPICHNCVGDAAAEFGWTLS